MWRGRRRIRSGSPWSEAWPGLLCWGRKASGWFPVKKGDRANFMSHSLSDLHITFSCPVPCPRTRISCLQDDDILTERTMHSKNIQMNSDSHVPIHTCCITHGEMICKQISSISIKCFVKINFSKFSARILKKLWTIKLKNTVSFLFLFFK